MFWNTLRMLLVAVVVLCVAQVAHAQDENAPPPSPSPGGINTSNPDLALPIGAGGNVVMTVTPGGNIGIDNPTPVEALDVGGAMRVGDDGSACTPVNAGTVIFVSPSTRRFMPCPQNAICSPKIMPTGFYGCDGTNWNMLAQ
jgi:hypothetical protein